MSGFLLIFLIVFLIVNVLVFISSSFPTEASTQSQWVTGSKMPTARSEVTATLLNGKIYVIGGQDKNGEPVNDSEAYDFKIDKWSVVAPLPIPLDHASAAVYNKRIYFLGGRSINDTASDKLFIYDPVLDKWTEGKPMPTARYGLTANFVNGTLYAIGGKNTRLMGFAHENLNLNEAYNPKTQSWTSKAPMPNPRHHLTSAVVGGKLYAIGGRHTGIQQVQLNNNEMYDPVNDSWTTKALMPSNRSAIAAAVTANGYIYVLGGEACDIRDNSSRMVFDNNEKYDPKTDKWTSEAPMPTARHGAAVQFVNGSIYVIGGGPEPCNSTTSVNEIFKIN